MTVLISRRGLIQGGAATALFSSIANNGAFAEQEPYPGFWDRKGVPFPVDFSYEGPHSNGSLLIDQLNQYLYFIQKPVGSTKGRVTRYVIGAAKGEFMSEAERVIYDYKKFPSWTPRGSKIAIPPGPKNFLGARVMWLRQRGFNGKTGIDEDFAIHGTHMPELLLLPDGQRRISGGCIRLANEDVAALFSKILPNPSSMPNFPFVHAFKDNSFRQFIGVQLTDNSMKPKIILG